MGRERRLNVALLTEKQRAEQAADTKARFLANMSHEIRTPMNGVLGMLRLVMKTTLDSRQRDYLQKAQSSAQALLAIINDVLDFSKIEAGHFTLEQIEYDLSATMETVFNAVSLQAQEKGLELILHIDPGLPLHLVGDPLRLRQILINLVGNAIKFTESGDVVVSVSQTETDDGERQLNIAVSDTGPGMSAMMA